MAETTTSPEPGLEGESELSRQGIWQGHSGSCKGKYRRGVPTVDPMCISVPGVGLLKQLCAGARRKSAVSKEFASQGQTIPSGARRIELNRFRRGKNVRIYVKLLKMYTHVSGRIDPQAWSLYMR